MKNRVYRRCLGICVSKLREPAVSRVLNLLRRAS